MPTATTAPYLALLDATLDDETFVTQTFRLMEADLRALALSALADWDAAGLHAAAPVLFQAVGTLQRPAWGAWNGLLLALAKARRTIAREGDAATRKQLEEARVALAILTGLERKVDAALAGDCAALIALAGHQGGLTQLQLLTLTIRLRYLVDLDLRPMRPERNLYRTRPQAPTWSESHPFHWLPAAEQGDRHAMLELGIIFLIRPRRFGKSLLQSALGQPLSGGATYAPDRREFLPGLRPRPRARQRRARDGKLPALRPTRPPGQHPGVALAGSGRFFHRCESERLFPP
jgi:hypothetical protein